MVIIKMILIKSINIVIKIAVHALMRVFIVINATLLMDITQLLIILIFALRMLQLDTI
jgi:hypothetical protein